MTDLSVCGRQIVSWLVLPRRQSGSNKRHVLSKTRIGEYLGELGSSPESQRFHVVRRPARAAAPCVRCSGSQALLKEYLNMFSFFGLSLDAALRYVLWFRAFLCWVPSSGQLGCLGSVRCGS
jgi:hypothetical protein